MHNSIIFNQLIKHAEEEIISFHIPGHKNGKILQKLGSKFLLKEMMALDVTEMPDTDNLHAPKGIIKEAQKRAARVFCAEHTFFLINGTSTGNISALMTVLDPQDKVIIPRDCHKSVMHGLIMGDLIPVYINPEVNQNVSIPMGIKPETVEKALEENPDAKAVVITYPNYYGICSDIAAIADVVHKHNKILIVDEAHGSHFILSDNLPIPSIKAGADIVSQSIHKTLPSLTQSSMLHVKSSRIDIDRLKFMLLMNQSSSPSYLLMASLDLAAAIVEKDGSGFMENLMENISYFYKRLQNIKGIKTLDRNLIGKYGIKDMDPTRLVINMTELGVTGTQLDELLRSKYNIQMELSDIYNVVGVSTIGNDKSDFDKLLNALADIAKRKGRTENVFKSSSFFHSYSVPIMKATPREAAFSRKIEMPFKESAGRISGEYIIPYPPGIPILCPGEEITNEIIEHIDDIKKYGVNIIGMKDDQLKIIKVLA